MQFIAKKKKNLTISYLLLFQKREQFSCVLYRKKLKPANIFYLPCVIPLFLKTNKIKLNYSCVTGLRGTKKNALNCINFFLCCLFFPMENWCYCPFKLVYNTLFFCSQSQLFCYPYTLEIQLKISIAIFHFIGVDHNGSLMLHSVLCFACVFW